MSDYVTASELTEILDERLKTQTDEIVGAVHAFMTQVDKRFNKIEAKQDASDFKIEARFDKLEVRMDTFDHKMERLINSIDGFIKRLDDHDAELAAWQNQMDKLLVWAKKVSDKTGIPLENL